jgi:hypothetical protein
MTAALLRDADAPAIRLSVPARGRVLSTVAESYGKPIREAAQIIVNGLGREPIPLPDWLSGSPDIADGQIVLRPDGEMVARHICTQWVIGVALRVLAPSDSLERAAGWFGSASERALVPVLSRLTTRCKAQARASEFGGKPGRVGRASSLRARPAWPWKPAKCDARPLHTGHARAET